MPSASSAGADTDLDRLRREYEASLSWRVTRPLRAFGRRRTPRLRASRAEYSPGSSGPDSYDSWLEHFYDERLARIDAACEHGGPESFALFRDLDVDLWALLLSKEYGVYPNIRSLLPSVPDRSLQEWWNGASGALLINQGKSFYSKLTERIARHSDRSLGESRVLDFGCGWGRLIRYLARDVAPGSLYGCDPIEEILDVCRKSGVPATLAHSELLPTRLPFDEKFDLAYAFSVFTHLSEAAHESCLGALHGSLRPGGILVLTVRPPHYLELSPLMREVRESLGPHCRARLEEPHYLFAPHPGGPDHSRYAGGEMTYGSTVITLPYMRERWFPMFELLDVDLMLGDLYQVMVTLRRR